MMLRVLALLVAVAATTPLAPAHATPGDDPLVPLAAPYEPNADAEAAVAAALEEAAASDRLVLLLFGANWCPDCRRFSELLAEPDVAPLVREQFVIAKVDVGNWDNNVTLTQRYGDPIAEGIPAAVFLRPQGDHGQVVAATMTGELSRARHFEAEDVLHFLEGVLARGREPAGTEPGPAR